MYTCTCVYLPKQNANHVIDERLSNESGSGERT